MPRQVLICSLDKGSSPTFPSDLSFAVVQAEVNRPQCDHASPLFVAAENAHAAGGPCPAETIGDWPSRNSLYYKKQWTNCESKFQEASLGTKTGKLTKKNSCFLKIFGN